MAEVLTVPELSDIQKVLESICSTKQNRTEQNRREQSRAEQRRTEKSRSEQSRAEQSRTEQNKTSKSSGHSLIHVNKMRLV